MNSPPHHTESLAEDLLRGAEAIGSFIGEPPKAVYYLAERGYAPIGREGATLIASKRKLREHYARVTAGKSP